MTWGRCLSSFQLTFLRNEFVAPFLPLLTYAMFCLAEGRYLPGVGSSVNGLLHFIILASWHHLGIILASSWLGSPYSYQG